MRWLWGLVCHAVDDHRICSDIGSSHVLKLDVLSQEMPSHVGWWRLGNVVTTAEPNSNVFRLDQVLRDPVVSCPEFFAGIVDVPPKY